MFVVLRYKLCHRMALRLLRNIGYNFFFRNFTEQGIRLTILNSN